MSLGPAEENGEAWLPERLKGRERHSDGMDADPTRARSTDRAGGRITQKTGQIAGFSARRTSKRITRPSANPKADRPGQIRE